MSLVFWLLCLVGLCDFDRDWDCGGSDSERVKALEQELSRTTRLLCEASKVIRHGTVPSPELLAWFNEHDELDKRKGR